MLGSPVKFVDRDYVIFEGKKLLYLSGIDYHRMSNDPEEFRNVRAEHA